MEMGLFTSMVMFWRRDDVDEHTAVHDWKHPGNRVGGAYFNTRTVGLARTLSRIEIQIWLDIDLKKGDIGDF